MTLSTSPPSIVAVALVTVAITRALAARAAHDGEGPSAPPLLGPFSIEARRAAHGRPLPDPPVPPAVPPIVDVIGVSYYVDAKHSAVDPARRRDNEAAFAPLRRYVAGVTALADGWAASRPARPAYAAAAVDALAAWARAGALLGAVNQQGRYERVWTLSGLALAYLKVRDAPGIAPATHAVVERWLAAVARAAAAAHERAGATSRANNHACWVALAVAAAGVAGQDRALFAWGVARGRGAIAEVRPDGFLPLELARGPLALHYHVFALAPLVMLAEIGARNGVDLYGAADGAIGRLAGRVVTGLADPAAFAAAAGATQQTTQPPRRGDLAWAEPYAARFPDRRLAAWLAAARPLRDDRLGGDVTAAFAPDLSTR